MSQPLILSVETATLSGSVAVSRGEEILGVVTGDPSISHSNTLLDDVDKLLTETQIALPEIDLFAVATGPGSFTGLRIGIATIKRRRDFGSSGRRHSDTRSRCALRRGLSATVALLPAGRGEVFTQLFSVTGSTQLNHSTKLHTFHQHDSSSDTVIWKPSRGVATAQSRIVN